MRWPDQELTDIHSREDLARFLITMAERVRSGSISVENPSTDDFLDAAGRWTRAMDGFFANMMDGPVPEDPDWSTIGAIVWAGLVYE